LGRGLHHRHAPRLAAPGSQNRLTQPAQHAGINLTQGRVPIPKLHCPLVYYLPGLLPKTQGQLWSQRGPLMPLVLSKFWKQTGGSFVFLEWAPSWRFSSRPLRTRTKQSTHGFTQKGTQPRKNLSGENFTPKPGPQSTQVMPLCLRGVKTRLS
jgi:hypothetical protein